ncbi:uncharacterized protein ACA1_237410 [Acanthamoeba castellanii str. Neff]|uniref:Uncharacterized protein n=1 Tax=Acanthamoeba castellanii (strain ATCC 30010 / Neff) TaxID=1257118 RepID=L8H1L8_ACACF|nr:uncharacterized protein ACA1_237410 [Acanthamoeba castellanii str. Neff]ELR19092.1 hypothetical protein ACA1_237410 [Acanthamoeba castellanii str. Neff]
MTSFAEFEKLFKIPVPKLSEAAYYLSTLAQAKEYAQVWELAEAFAQMEDWLVNVEQKHRTITNYKMSVMAKIKDAVTATAAHQR